jgi:hypothetical protein
LAKQAKLSQRATSPTDGEPLAHITTPAPNYVESPDGNLAFRARDDSWAPTPDRRSSPILACGRQLRSQNVIASGTSVNSPLLPSTSTPALQLAAFPALPPLAGGVNTEDGYDGTSALTAAQPLYDTLGQQAHQEEPLTPLQDIDTALCWKY